MWHVSGADRWSYGRRIRALEYITLRFLDITAGFNTKLIYWTYMTMPYKAVHFLPKSEAFLYSSAAGAPSLHTSHSEKGICPMADGAYIRKYKIRKGLLKGVGLKGRHRRLLRREFKKTLRSYVGRPVTLAVGTAAALVSKKIKSLPGR